MNSGLCLVDSSGPAGPAPFTPTRRALKAHSQPPGVHFGAHNLDTQRFRRLTFVLWLWPRHLYTLAAGAEPVLGPLDRYVS
jgi:hypothetical protein